MNIATSSTAITQREDCKMIVLKDPETSVEQPYLMLLAPCGRGFYGAVYRAVHQHNPNLTWAVKVISVKNKEVKDQILRELEIIQRIPPSPNIVDTHKQHLESENNLYIFQEFCEGGSLLGFKEESFGKMLLEEEVYDLFFQLSRGLIDLYKAGIIHEDIKPANILRKGKRYKYCDFGVSEILSQVKHSTTRKGTVSYMPPEKFKHKFLPNDKSDIFSLGVTIYEVVFGQHPYLETKTKDYKEYLNRVKAARPHVYEEITRHRIYNPSLIFSSFFKFLQQMIDRKVEDRIGIKDLEQFITHHRPFDSMEIPGESEEIKINPNCQGSKNGGQKKAGNEQLQNVIGVSKIMMRELSQQKAMDELGEAGLEKREKLPNRLINPAPIKHSNSKSHMQASKADRRSLKEQQFNQEQQMEQEFPTQQCCVKDNIDIEHELLQRVINYITDGMKFYEKCCKAIKEDIAQCGPRYFLQIDTNVESEHVMSMFNLLTRKLSQELMKTFKSMIEEHLYLEKEEQLETEIEFLECELYKFLAEDKMQTQTAVMKELKLADGEGVNLGKILISEFQKLFEDMVCLNSVRINFKDDLLSAIFLKNVGDVLENLHRIGFLKGHEEANRQTASEISCLLMGTEKERINAVVKRFNLYKTLPTEELRKHLYEELKNEENILYDGEENTDEWINVSDLIEDEEFIEDREANGEIQMNE